METAVSELRTRGAPSIARGWGGRAGVLTARTEGAAAVLDGRIYLVGGYQADGRTIGAFERYDPATDRWTALAPLPEGRNHPSLAALDGRLYAIGGYDPSGRPTNTVWSYEPTGDLWRAASPLPLPRAA